MGAMRRLPSSNGAATDAAPVQQQQVVYSSLDDISSRVEIYKGRYAMLASHPTEQQQGIYRSVLLLSKAMQQLLSAISCLGKQDCSTV
jgi:hypothetical protein